jgi:hypothetical protein
MRLRDAPLDEVYQAALAQWYDSPRITRLLHLGYRLAHGLLVAAIRHSARRRRHL